MGLPITFLRSSSIKEYLDCPLRFFASYCLGLRFPSGPSAISGTIFHEIMEELAHNKDADLDELTERIYKKHIDQIDPARIPKTYQRKTPESSVRTWVPLKKVKNSIVNVMSMSPRSFDVRHMDVLRTELKFDVEIKEPWANYSFELRGKHHEGYLRLKGSIDLVIRNENGELEIIDWKSGRSEDMSTGEPKTFESYCEDMQMALYSYVCRKYLGLDISYTTLVFLNEGQCFSVQFDDDLVEERIKTIWQEIQSCDRPTKNDSLFCQRFCPYSKSCFDVITTKPLVKPREYDWVNEAGLLEHKTYRICGQLWNYFVGGYTPMQVCEALMRDNHNIDQYVNT